MRELRGPLGKAYRELVHCPLPLFDVRRLSAASLLLKCPRVLVILRNLPGTLWTATVVRITQAARLRVVEDLDVEPGAFGVSLGTRNDGGRRRLADLRGCGTNR